MMGRHFICAIMYITIYLIHQSVSDLKSGENLPDLPKIGMKTILLWNSYYGKKDYHFGFGNRPFHTNNCAVNNCYLTNERTLLEMDRYSAIIFHMPFFEGEIPKSRRKHQIYVFLSKESPYHFKIPGNTNEAFNLTMTHRLDSDLPVPYIKLVDTSEKRVAPSYFIKWRKPPSDDIIVRKKYEYIIKSKLIPVVWFASRCTTPNKRENYVEDLQKYIKVDIYGRCGTLSCRHRFRKYCNNLIKSKYYFYLSFENANCKDYVSEKLLNALDNDAVPVVYGGANYSFFLPPSSYINAADYTPQELADLMNELIEDPNQYIKFFWWKEFYRTAPSKLPICNLCEYLNNKKVIPKTYPDMRLWWEGSQKDKICDFEYPDDSYLTSIE